MAEYTIYTTATGQITKLVSCDPDLISFQYDSGTEGYVDGFYDEALYYVTGGTATARTALPYSFDTTGILANGTDAATISSLPNPTTYEIVQTTDSGINTYTGTVTDGSLAITINADAEVSVTLETYQYLQFTDTVLADSEVLYFFVNTAELTLTTFDIDIGLVPVDTSTLTITPNEITIYDLS